MAITPDTTIKLLKVPIEIDNFNQLTFASKEAQYNYFNSCPQLEADDLYYQRKDNYISFPAHIDDILQYNYVMYQNSNYSNKWFYAFITNMVYENDGTTNIFIETDVFQTWQFDIIYKASFIEREHVNDDTIGKNTIPENLNVGEVIEESYDEYLMGTPDPLFPDEDLYYFAIESTYNPITNEDFTGSKKINGNLFGSYIFCFGTESVDLTYIKNFLADMSSQSKIDSVLNFYILPKKLVDTITTTRLHKGSTLGDYYLDYLNSSNESVTDSKNITKTHSFSGITIKNNKCFCYPYNYLLVSNNVGNHNIYKYEEFSDTTANFEIEMAVSIGASVRIEPKNYKNIAKNYDESLGLAKYPTASWSSDAFTNWLTSQAVNITTSLISSLTNSLITKNITNTAGNISSLIGEFYQASLLPSITGGNNNGDVNFSSKCNKFSFHHMRSKNEYMKQIDDYFSMYGYKINNVKLPNISGRTNWNYVKLVNANIEGNIPQLDLQKIKEIFNQGVTLWHNPSTFLDYTQSNAII